MWGNRFDAFLKRTMTGRPVAVSPVRQDLPTGTEERKVYDLNGRRVASLSDIPHGVYIVKNASGSRKVLK